MIEDTNLLKNVVYNISPNEIREIINILNQKPFDENFTLYSFDAWNKEKLHSLINKIIQKIDNEKEFNFKLNNEEVENQINEFFYILGYPNSNEDLGKNIINGEKNIIHSVIYYILKGIEDLKVKAYLGKYLVPIKIRDEFIADEDIKKLIDQNNELIEEFSKAHKIIKDIEKENENPNELARRLNLLEQEKNQLKNKINDFKQKQKETKDFKFLLNSITKSRKEQEENQNLIEQINYLNKCCENIENESILSEQKLFDAKKAYGNETTANEMLYSLKSDLNQNKNKLYELINNNVEKKRKVIEYEEKLSEPIPQPEEIKEMENKVINLRTITNDLKNRLDQEKKSDKEDFLSINKQMAMKTFKKKEQVTTELNTLEQNLEELEEKFKTVKNEIELKKGPGFENKNDIMSIKKELDKKIKIKNEKEDEIRLLEYEKTILEFTEKKIDKQFKNLRNELKEFEEKYKIVGLNDLENEIEDLTGKKGDIDIAKGKTLEEMARIITNINSKINDKEKVLKPLFEKKKEVLDKINDIYDDYINKKESFSKATELIREDIEQLENDLNSKKTRFEENYNSIIVIKEKMNLFKNFEKMLDVEENNSLNSEHKNYTEWFKDIILKNEKTIYDLKKERDEIKNNIHSNIENKTYINDLKNLLELKLNYKKNLGINNNEHDENNNNVNRMVI